MLSREGVQPVYSLRPFRTNPQFQQKLRKSTKCLEICRIVMKMISSPTLNQTSITQLTQTFTVINSRDLIEDSARIHITWAIKRDYSLGIEDYTKIREIWTRNLDWVGRTKVGRLGRIYPIRWQQYHDDSKVSIVYWSNMKLILFLLNKKWEQNY